MPDKEDAFGSHENIAKAIKNIIKNQEGGKTIALKGSWGSGKSTIIRNVKKLLQEEKNDECDIKIFTYNTWSHEGDPLRRSFLEKLIDFLKYIDWGYNQEKDGDESLDDIKDKISRKKIERRINREPSISKRGVIFGVLLLLIPLGAALFSFASQDLLRDDFLYFFVIAGLFMLMPIIYSIFHFINEYRRYNKHNNKEAKFKMGYLFNKVNHTITDKSKLSPHPTSVEFLEVFENLMENFLKGEERKIVIVMDNIDRINPEEALDAWSVMRLFTEYRENRNNEKKEEWRKKIWVIVPYDEGAIKSLWETKKEEQQNLDDNATEEKTDIDVSSAFLDKTFQVEFQVPKLLLSNWRSFFKDQLKDAFNSEISKDERNSVCGTFHNFLKEKGGNDKENNDWDLLPTPRDIKVFINKMVVLYNQAELLNENIKTDKINIKDIAKYIKEGEKESIDLESEDVNLRLQKKYAALYFNKLPKKSLEIVLKEPMKRAIKKVDKKKVKRWEEGLDEFEEFLNGTKDEIFESEMSKSILFAIVNKENKKQINFSNEKVEGELVDKCEGKGFDKASFWAFKGVLQNQEDRNDLFSDLLESIFEIIEKDKISEKKQYKYIIKTLLKIRNETEIEIDERLKKISDNGTFLKKIPEVQDEDTIAHLVFITFEYLENLSKVRCSLNLGNLGEKFLKSYIHLLSRFSSFHNLANIVSNKPELTRNILLNFIRESQENINNLFKTGRDYRDLINKASNFYNLEEFETAEGRNVAFPRAILDGLNSEHINKFDKKLAGKLSVDLVNKEHRLYRDTIIKSPEGKTKKSLEKKLSKNGLTADKLKEELTNQSKFIKLIIELKESGIDLGIYSVRLVKGLKKYFEDAFRDLSIDELLKPTQIKVLLEYCVETEEKKEIISDEFLKTIKGAMESDATEKLSWLNKVLSEISEVIEISKIKSTSLFGEDTIQEIFSDSEENKINLEGDTKEVAKVIADQLNINI